MNNIIQSIIILLLLTINHNNIIQCKPQKLKTPTLIDNNDQINDLIQILFQKDPNNIIQPNNKKKNYNRYQFNNKINNDNNNQINNKYLHISSNVNLKRNTNYHFELSKNISQFNYQFMNDYLNLQSLINHINISDYLVYPSNYFYGSYIINQDQEQENEQSSDFKLIEYLVPENSKIYEIKNLNNYISVNNFNIKPINEIINILDILYKKTNYSITNVKECFIIIKTLNYKVIFPSPLKVKLLFEPHCITNEKYTLNKLKYQKLQLNELLPNSNTYNKLNIDNDIPHNDYNNISGLFDEQDENEIIEQELEQDPNNNNSYDDLLFLGTESTMYKRKAIPYNNDKIWYSIGTNLEFISNKKRYYALNSKPFNEFEDNKYHIQSFKSIFQMIKNLNDIGYYVPSIQFSKLHQMIYNDKNNVKIYRFVLPLMSKYLYKIDYNNNMIRIEDKLINLNKANREVIYSLIKIYLKSRNLLPCTSYLDTELRDMNSPNNKFNPNNSSILKHITNMIGIDSLEYDFIYNSLLYYNDFQQLIDHPFWNSLDNNIDLVYHKHNYYSNNNNQNKIMENKLYKDFYKGINLKEITCDNFNNIYVDDSVSRIYPIFNFDYGLRLISSLKRLYGNKKLVIRTINLMNNDRNKDYFRPYLLVEYKDLYDDMINSVNNINNINTKIQNGSLLSRILHIVHRYNKHGLLYLLTDFTNPYLFELPKLLLLNDFNYSYKSKEFESFIFNNLNYINLIKNQIGLKCEEFNDLSNLFVANKQSEVVNSVKPLFSSYSPLFNGRIKNQNYKLKLDLKTDTCLLGQYLLRYIYSLSMTNLRDGQLFNFNNIAVPNELELQLLSSTLFVESKKERLLISQILRGNGSSIINHESIQQLFKTIRLLFNSKSNTIAESVKVIDNESEDDLCSICLVQYQNKDKIGIPEGCKHEFHWECIKKWHEINQNCPFCRSSSSSIKRVGVLNNYNYYLYI